MIFFQQNLPTCSLVWINQIAHYLVLLSQQKSSTCQEWIVLERIFLEFNLTSSKLLRSSNVWFTARLTIFGWNGS